MSIILDNANIVVPATSVGTFEAIASIPSQDRDWDCVELRLDLFDAVPRQSDCPLLLTPRHPDEGGEDRCAFPDQRAALCDPWLPVACAIDIEIAHARAMASLIARARDAGLVVVLSFHDFETTPSFDALAERVRVGIDLGADVVKLATLTTGAGDVARLLSLLERFPDQNLAVMGMGQLGKASRLVLASCGSVLNYAAHADATVEGQWQAAAFRRLLEETGVR